MQIHDLLRSAYMHRFQKDIPAKSLEEDVDSYLIAGKVPPYLSDFMVDFYGAH